MRLEIMNAGGPDLKDETLEHKDSLLTFLGNYIVSIPPRTGAFFNRGISLNAPVEELEQLLSTNLPIKIHVHPREGGERGEIGEIHLRIEKKPKDIITVVIKGEALKKYFLERFNKKVEKHEGPRKIFIDLGASNDHFGNMVRDGEGPPDPGTDYKVVNLLEPAFPIDENNYPKNVQFVKADGAEMSFLADSSVSEIYIGNVFGYHIGLKKTIEILKEAARVLSEDGELVVAEFVSPDDSEIKPSNSEKLRKLLEECGLELTIVITPKDPNWRKEINKYSKSRDERYFTSTSFMLKAKKKINN